MDLVKLGGIPMCHPDTLNVSSKEKRVIMVVLRFEAQATGCIMGLFTEMGIQEGAGLMKKIGVRLRVLTWVY